MSHHDVSRVMCAAYMDLVIHAGLSSFSSCLCRPVWLQLPSLEACVCLVASMWVNVQSSSRRRRGAAGMFERPLWVGGVGRCCAFSAVSSGCGHSLLPCETQRGNVSHRAVTNNPPPPQPTHTPSAPPPPSHTTSPLCGNPTTTFILFPSLCDEKADFSRFWLFC